MDNVNLEEKFVITRNFIKHTSPNYAKEVQSALEKTKYLFPQLRLFADPALKFIRENSISYFNLKPIKSSPFLHQPYRFELYPKDEATAFNLLKSMHSQVASPIILDFLLHVNYLHDTFPSLLPNLNELYFHIFTENKIPLIQLALISHLFSISSINIRELTKLYKPQKINHPGKVVSCILATDNNILPLSLGDTLFSVSEDSIYLYFFQHEYVFTPSKLTLQYRKKSKPEKVNTKDFSAFLLNADTEPLESIGIINDQLYFAQKFDNRTIRISTFKTGILCDNIQRKESIVVLKSDYYQCTFFKKNLMIFLTNGKKYLYDVTRCGMIKNPQLFNFYYDFSDISIYNSSDDQFVLVTQDGDNLLFEIIKHQTAKSTFMQILPPFYGTTTDEIISHLSFELLNLSTDILSSLMNHGFYEDENNDDKSKVVSQPLIHIDYALDLADIILKNSQNHDQKLCDFCLIATTRFIIVNAYQLYAMNNYLAKSQMNRITNLFSSMKITIPHFDTLFSMITVINHGIYTNNFISKVLRPFFPLLEENITKSLMQSPSFILFINKESIKFMSLKDKMKMIQSQAPLLIDMYSEINSDKALIPFMTVFFDVLQESLISKSVSNAAVCAYFASILPFLCTMNNTPQLSIFVLKQLIKCIERLSKRLISIISPIDKMFSGDASLDHFKETKTLSITFFSKFFHNFDNLSGLFDEFLGLTDTQFDGYRLYHTQEIFNKSFRFLENWTEDDFLIYLLPNALINSIEICYKSIEITQTEIDNERFIHYGIYNDISKEVSVTKKKDRLPKRQISYPFFTLKDERNFLTGLNDTSILIQRLRKEVKCVIRGKEELELLIFKALLYQARIVNYAHAVTEKSTINPLVIHAWKLAIKIRSNLKFSRQHSQDKRINHTNLNERFSDYCQSIQEKCECLLKQTITDAPVNTIEWMQLNYSFITSNLLLSELSTLSKIAKLRKNIKEFSLTALKQILQMELPASFKRSLVSYLFRNEILNTAIKNDEELIQILLMSPDPFNRLSVFNCITIDRYTEIADYMVNENQENNQTILTFCDIFAEKEEIVNIDSLLEIIGHCSYEYVPGIPSYKLYEYINIVQEHETTLNLISRIKSCNNESIGSMTILCKKKNFDVNESKLIAEQLCLLNFQIDLQLRTFILLNLILNLLCLISNKSHEINQLMRAIPIDFSILPKFINTTEFRNFYPDSPTVLLDILREMNENKSQNHNKEPPRFIQLKGSNVSPNQSNKLRLLPKEFNYFIFSKPIDGTENIKFKIEQKGVCMSDLYYLKIGMINIFDQKTIILMNIFGKDNCIYKNLESNLFYFTSRQNLQMEGIQGPIIPFIFAIGCDIEITYYYNTSYENYLGSSHVYFSIDETSIPKTIVGTRVSIENVGDGIIIETNENNDDVVVSLYTKNQSLAYINSSSNIFKEIEDLQFLTLLRTLTIIEGYSDSSLIETYLGLILPQISEQYYLFYEALKGNYSTLFSIINTENSFAFILFAFKDIFLKFLNDNIPILFQDNSMEVAHAGISLLRRGFFYNQLHFILVFTCKQPRARFSRESTYFVVSNMTYNKIEYDDSEIEYFVSLLMDVISFENLINHLMENRIFMKYLIDLFSFLFENAFSKVEQVLIKCPNLHMKLICHACFKPTKLTKFVVFSYFHYELNQSFIKLKNRKFRLSIPCINVNTNERLNAEIEHSFNEEIQITAIKPNISIEELKRDIEELNSDPIDKASLLIWAYEQPEELYINNRFNLKQSIIYCLICIADILKRFEPIPLLLPLPEKLNLVRRTLLVSKSHPLSLVLSRMQNKHQLLFDQFCSQVSKKLRKLRNKVPFQVSFVAESGIDASGLKREAITLIYKELIDLNNKIFQLDQNGFLIPSANCSSHRLKCAGAFIAACFISNNPRDFHLAPRIWELFTLSEPKSYSESEMALKLGFNIVVPVYGIDACLPSDIRKLTCGDSFTKQKFIDKCEFYNQDVKNIFLAAIADFTIPELQQLLSFITGTQTLPFDPDFQIRISFLSQGNQDEKNWPLPIAHTCFKSVEIAPFTDPTILADKLRFAMHTIMISDGQPNWENLDL